VKVPPGANRIPADGVLEQSQGLRVPAGQRASVAEHRCAERVPSVDVPGPRDLEALFERRGGLGEVPAPEAPVAQGRQRGDPRELFVRRPSDADRFLGQLEGFGEGPGFGLGQGQPDPADHRQEGGRSPGEMEWPLGRGQGQTLAKIVPRSSEVAKRVVDPPEPDEGDAPEPAGVRKPDPAVL